MGFKRQSKEYRLHFEGTELDGLVVHVKSIPVGAILDLAALAELANEVTAEGLKSFGLMLATLADAMVSWNLEDDDDQPVPATIEGIKTLQVGDAMLLIKAWMDAAAGVSGPLDRPSTGGSPSPVVSLPMEPLSPSRAS
jgi:hypothetical protein